MSPPTSTPRRQLIIGLDAGEWNLVRRWADAGKLPTFRRLMDSGAHGTLTTTAEQLPDTVWSSIYSGKNPATFDKYFYVQYDPRTRNLRHVKDDSFTKEPFWQVLSDAGRRVGVVDAVKFPCSRSLNGFMVTNWGAHATKTTRASCPTALMAEVDARIGRNPVGDVDKMNDSARSRRDMRERLLTGLTMRGELVRWLMQEREWDVFFTAFSEMHQSGHFFWQGVDPDHPRHEEIVGEGVADTVERVYSKIDEEIGSFLRLVDDDTLCIVVAGHGMGPLYHASWSLPEMLDLWGFGPNPARRAESAEARRNPWRVLNLALPGWLKYAIKGSLPERWQNEILFRWYAGARAWDGWRAFAVPNNDSCGAIRIAVKGRDAGGLVEPGAEYDALCDEITAALTELVDPKTRRPVVHRVTKVHELFDGPFKDQLPDLTIHWEQSFSWSSVESPRFGTLQLARQDARTGSHTGHGFFLASGSGVPAGIRVEGRSIFDIAPTIYQAAGIALPTDLDGAPLPILGNAVVA